MNIIAILSGVLVGFTLGLVGGGGSVLATPLLLYAIVGLPPHVAIGTGAFAVSVNAFLNFLAQIRSGRIIWKVAILFAIFGSFGAFVGSSVGKAMNGDKLIFVFGLAMLGVGAAMLWPIEPKLDAAGKVVVSGTKSALVAVGVGCLAGFFGIGGGVLIVPGLVLATRMPMLNAISTSLLAVTSFGLTTAVNYAVSGLVDWVIAAQFIGGGLLGGFLGIRAGIFLSRSKGALNKAFAALTFAVACYVLYRSGTALFGPQVGPPPAAVERAAAVAPDADPGPAVVRPTPPVTPESSTKTADPPRADLVAGAGQQTAPAAVQSDDDSVAPRKGPAQGVEAELDRFLDSAVPPQDHITWFDLDRVRFAPGATRPGPAAAAQLRIIAAILAAHPTARAVVGGHTDASGDAGKNRTVATLRAEYVRRELTLLGVAASRLEARGFAGDVPIATNRTAAGRAQNRRISIGVIRP